MFITLSRGFLRRSFFSKSLVNRFAYPLIFSALFLPGIAVSQEASTSLPDDKKITVCEQILAHAPDPVKQSLLQKLAGRSCLQAVLGGSL